MRRNLSKIASWMRGKLAKRAGKATPLLGINVPMFLDQQIDPEVELDVARRLAAMPPFVREIYLLRMVDKMSIDEIGTRLAISRRSTRRYLRRAIVILAKDSAR